ncbi:MAG: DUF2202 domain-containing protein [Gammaproteobacteria bacterium]|nr:DUF2202 domain-containing protein [Gammaproteobacteria bacterium]MBU1722428.1 DUF2202 domain-containing protein [Gammaproteobacteria bacterium]MBU2004635.1 DUF2202 domain-containing protein [Gammaproteobacteria bacterium]
MKPFEELRSLLLVGSIILLTGCGGGASNAATNPTSTLTASLATLAALTPAETGTLLFVREEEKMARDVYLTLYDRWGLQVFQNIALRSEQQHMDSIKLLIDNLGLADPVVSDAVGSFTNPDIAALYAQLVNRGLVSLDEALAVGSFIEEFDINDLQEAIDEAMDGTNQLPVIQIYTNLMCGSRNHLRAFVGQIESTGDNYVAQVIDQQTVDLIADSSPEQCAQ